MNRTYMQFGLKAESRTFSNHLSSIYREAAALVSAHGVDSNLNLCCL